ncbi:MAG: ABC transporter ATP-binding protein [Actinomycetota bacterium]
METISIKNLSKSYGSRKVLDNINLDIGEGEFYCLLGPNGSGKTTISSIMAGIRKPDSGEVQIYGKSPQKARGFLGYIPQESFSDPNLTGWGNLDYFAKLLGYGREERKRMVKILMEKIELTRDAGKRVANYSGGMKKRLELATVLFPGIKLLILDEPTTGLDPSARRKFFSYIDEIRDEKTTIFLISHIGSDTETATRVGLIDNGKIIAEGSSEKLKNNSGLKNIVSIDTSIKNDSIKKLLHKFNEAEEVLEYDSGYRIFTVQTAEIIPEIVRGIEKMGFKVLKISVSVPTIEDVFFKITGKSVEGV